MAETFDSYYGIRAPTIPIGDMDVAVSLGLLAAQVRMLGNCGLICVSKDSSRRLRKAVHKIATYFHREERYDFVQYSSQEYDPIRTYKKVVATDLTLRAFAWFPQDAAFSERCPLIGAACFRSTRTLERKPLWNLDWVWIHPFERNKGLFRRSVPVFRKILGDFLISPPHSRAMANYVRKYAWEWHQDLIDKILVEDA